MRETVKALVVGIRVLVLGTMVILVLWAGLTRPTGPIGQAPADGVLADRWSDVPARTWVPKGCWQGEAPADVTVPGHVYAWYPDGTQGVRGPVWVGKALDSVFGKKPVKGLQVIAFCR